MPTLRKNCYAAQQSQSLHQHDETQVTLLMTGAIDEQSTFARKRLSALQIVVKPAGFFHANEFIEDSSTIQISLEREAADRLGLDRWCTVRESGAIRHFLIVLEDPKVIRKDVHATGRWLKRLAQSIRREAFPDAPRVCKNASHSTGSAHPPVDGFDMAGPEDASRIVPSWLIECRRYLDNHHALQLSLERLARDAGVHRVSLARAFRKHVGLSIGEYLRLARLVHAANRIGKTNDSMVAIATEAGFSDQSHMNRMFRKQTGMTPRQFRRCVQEPIR